MSDLSSAMRAKADVQAARRKGFNSPCRIPTYY